MKKTFPCRSASARRRAALGLTLVEVMVALLVFSAGAAGVMAMVLQSRRITEFNACNHAANNIAFSLVEQMKIMTIDYGNPANSLLPRPADAAHGNRRWVRVRYGAGDSDQLDLIVPDVGSSTAPVGTPGPGVQAADIGAIDNVIGPIDMTQMTGVPGQQLSLTVWVWVDSNYQPTTMSPVTKVTVVYTYVFSGGSGQRVIRNSVQFLKAPRNTINQTMP